MLFNALTAPTHLKMADIIVTSSGLRSRATAIRVYFCVVEGLTYYEIAQRLNIKYFIAYYHARRILKRMK